MLHLERKFNTFSINVFSALIAEVNRVFAYDVDLAKMNLSNSNQTSLILECNNFKIRIELKLREKRIRLKLSYFTAGYFCHHSYYTLIANINSMLDSDKIKPSEILRIKNFKFINNNIQDCVVRYIQRVLTKE